jgi:hypothetical protein
MRNKICDLIVITCFIAMLALPLAFSDKTGESCRLTRTDGRPRHRQLWSLIKG